MYLLREDMYNEWSWENGATDIICLSNNAEIIEKKLQEKLDEYKSRDYIIEFYRDDTTLLEQIKRIKGKGTSAVYIDIYVDEYDYANGKNMATFVVSDEKIVG